MNLHNLKTTVRRKPRKRVGRGNGNNWGRTCGRGDKGQKSRSGATRRLHFEGGQIPLYRRLPKRGFKSRNHTRYAIVNVADLEQRFNDGDEVDLQALAAKGMLNKLRDGLKILGQGELTKKLTVTAHAFSATARAKIEAAGGTCVEPTVPTSEAPGTEPQTEQAESGKNTQE